MNGTTALLLLFVGLKLTGQIDWSWWWVLSPFWITLIFALVAIVITAFWQSKWGPR